ncbi:phosphoribosylglycinamide formyltransferase [Cyanobium sp. CH-040]|uniref:phosphoribosylglycinamide formyltransferase n=1 Tax=Cyanobium sp. CH-040 TaxID=2823708 RepID=UPI0020CEA159|nr:phosphoribosylglycinamide formyltransferase [Cyanobium sp. CH-040]MCP9928788.1 phosphoribosylglycinamide formyltransferase [Cyanobium sp. CH-040]
MPAFADPSQQLDGFQWPLQPPEAPPSAGRRLRLAVMASGEGSNFEALTQACRADRPAADVVLLVVNNPGCAARERASRLGVPCRLIDHRLQPSRDALDAALVEAFQEAQVDLVVMAGWMRIVTRRLVEAFPERLVNIHPSLLPSFRGMDAVGQALAAGVRLAGCTAHLVNEQVDAGRILVQAAVPVLEGDDHASLSARIQRQEHRILPLAVQLAAERLGLPAQG